MLAILWFLFIASVITIPLVWLLDHNGSVVITWLGYELQTDISTAILLTVFLSIFIFATSYVLARILAIKFPKLLKLFFKRSYTKKLEKIINKHQRAFDIMSQLMLALEVSDQKSSETLLAKFSKLIKYSALNNFFHGKISFEKKKFPKAAEYFLKFGENKNAKILFLKAKLEMALQHEDDDKAIAYAKQILSVRQDNIRVAQILFKIYKKNGLWQNAKSMIAEYGSDKFVDELQKRDVAVINSALALEAYQQKKFLQAIKHAKIALRSENNFLPAIEIMLKSWLKLGFAFKVSWKIKSMWRENPHLILAEIFDLIYRKSPAKTRIKMMKKLVELNNESALGKLAIGMVSYKTAQYQTAKEYLNISLLREKTSRAHRLLAFTEKALGHEDEFKRNISKAEMIGKDEHYTCNSCNKSSSKWSPRCPSCNNYDSLEWSL